jgi:hypothetical protein
MDANYGHPHDSTYRHIRDFLAETRRGIQCPRQSHKLLLC